MGSVFPCFGGLTKLSFDRKTEAPRTGLLQNCTKLIGKVSFCLIYRSLFDPGAAASNQLSANGSLLRGMQDLSSLTRDRTRAPCSGSLES